MRKDQPEELMPGALEKYSHDLTALAQQGSFTPLHRRDKEAGRVFQVLARRLKNNPMLIGEDSDERLAIVAEVVQRISTGDMPEEVKVRRVVALDVEALIADARTRGDFETLLKSVIAEIKQSAGQMLLFIDKFHVLVDAGGAENAVDMVNVLVSAWSRGEARILGTSTVDDYRKYVEGNQALQRRFQEILVGKFSDSPGISLVAPPPKRT